MNKKKVTKRLSKQLKKLNKRVEAVRAERKQLNKALKKAKKKETALEIELIALREELKEVTQIQEALHEDGPVTAAPPEFSADGDGGEVVSDNLRRLRGLGPKIEQLLHEAGIYTFEEVAGLSDEEWRTILQAAGPRYRRFDPTPWREQAAEAVRDQNGIHDDDDEE